MVQQSHVSLRSSTARTGYAPDQMDGGTEKEDRWEGSVSAWKNQFPLDLVFRHRHAPAPPRAIRHLRNHRHSAQFQQ